MADEHKGEETVALSEEMGRRRARLNPDDLLAPNCMWWAMIVGFAVLIGIMAMWGVANLNRIAG